MNIQNSESYWDVVIDVDRKLYVSIHRSSLGIWMTCRNWDIDDRIYELMSSVYFNPMNLIFSEWIHWVGSREYHYSFPRSTILLYSPTVRWYQRPADLKSNVSVTLIRATSHSKLIQSRYSTIFHQFRKWIDYNYTHNYNHYSHHVSARVSLQEKILKIHFERFFPIRFQNTNQYVISDENDHKSVVYVWGHTTLWM